MPERTVALTERQAALIDRLVAADRYEDEGDVIGEALRLVEEREAMGDAARLEALRAAVKVGLDQLDAGDYVEFTSPEALRDYLRGLVD